MSRRTKWFERFGREAPSRGRTTKRMGRMLGFEHCEPRIALSTNEAGGALHFTTGAVLSEGGIIGFDVSPTGQADSDSFLLNGSGSVRSTVNGGHLVLAGDQPAGPVVDFNHVISVGEFFSGGSKVQQIAAPVGAVLQPEGGQIVIIDAPHGELAALTHVESEVAQGSSSQSSLDRSAAGVGVGQAAARQEEGLRGRAIVFEVAHAKIKSTGHRASHGLDDANSDLASFDTSDALSASRVDAAQRTKAIAANNSADRADTSPHDSAGKPRSSQVAESAPVAPRPSGQTTAHVVARHASDDAHRSLDADAAAMLATRDAALEHWASAAAPLADKETAQELGALRSRKVLALALVLTVGAGPVSRLFRRRASAEAGREQPCQRPKPLDLA